MKTYIALLRGINVGGHNKILMADLKALFESLGYKDVKTYIQSGNVVFRANSKNNIQHNIKNALKLKYDWDIPVIVLQPLELQKVLDESPFTGDILVKSYFSFYETPPLSEDLNHLETLQFTNEHFHSTYNCIYIFYELGAGRAKLTTSKLEKLLKTKITARNYKTVNKLIHISKTL